MGDPTDFNLLLHEFLQQNPYSKIDTLNERAVVSNPWGDGSFIIELADSNHPVIGALNAVILPERYTALYHRDQRAMEFIYTAYPVEDEIATRTFAFSYGGNEYVCAFRQSSDRLLAIAQHYRPQKQTQTQFRNLASFRRWIGASRPKDGHALSFWVSPIDFDDDRMLDLVNHLNFFMSYFDVSSPQIVIHTPSAESVGQQPQTRMLIDRFPSKIVAKTIDDVLMAFWSAAQVGDPARRFLYNYQILEYCAHYYLEEGIRKRVRMELSAPHALDDVSALTETIIDAVSESTMHENIKMENLLRETVKPARLWREMERNLPVFCQRTIFQGGQTIPAIAKAGWKLEDFEVNWASSVAGALRKTRNALSHAKEQRGSAVIAPTGANFQKLQAWLPLMSTIANEVMVYRSVN